MDFIYLFRVLLKRKWIILGSAVLAAAIAYYFTRNEPLNYRSTAEISTGFTVSEENLINPAFNVYEAETKFNNVIVTFTSPTVTSLLSYMLILHDMDSKRPFRQLTPEQKQSPIYKQVNLAEARKIFQEKLDNMTVLTSYNQDEKKLLEFLRLHGYDYKTITQSLNVFRRDRTDYIRIDYMSHNPELSAFVVNNIFPQFLRYYRGVRSDKSQEAIDTLKKIMDSKKQELDIKNALLRDKGYSIGAEDASLSTRTLISDFENKLQDEKARVTDLEFDLRRVNQKLASLSSAPSTRPGSQNEEILMARKAATAAYRAYLDNPSDKTLLARYNQLNSEYQKMLSNSSNDNETVSARPGESRSDLLDKKAELEMDIQAGRTNIATYQGRINQLNGSVSALASQGATAEALLKERELANKEYLDAKEKWSNAIDYNSSSVNNFRQVVLGQPAIEPEPSKRKMIVGMAGAAAMVTSMLVIILLAYMDSSIKTPIIFSKTVGLKLISMINFANLKNRNLADIVSNKDNGENATEKNRNNIFRESLRKLRYEIERSGKKVFLFTSTKKGQGKTTLIQALSYSMSLSKKRILIIDTNFCNNDLTVQLNADPILEKIVPYKSDKEALMEQVKGFSKDIGVGTVYAIGSEGGDYTPSEILPRENILQHLHKLTGDFDYIFLEGPPLNDFSDSKELAQYVDGVIAVFSANHIIKQIDKQSISFFKELNGKFTGSILNMVDLKNVNVA
jgi:Mrp family chromosome partitioning ATPase/uncharacterized protein involved in exopolysaccharide biosynthesis